MLEFESIDKFYIKDRGTSFVIKPHEDLVYGDIDNGILFNKKVLIDGNEYIVKGIGTYCIARTPNTPVRLNFEILVAE